MSEQDKEQVQEETIETPAGVIETPDASESTKPEPEAPKDAEDAAEDPVDELGGDRDRAVDSESIAIEEKEASNDEEEGESAIPSFFIGSTDEGEERERVRVEVDILTSKKTGKVMSVARTGLGLEDEFKKLNHLLHSRMWFEFTVPDYQDISSYRKQCGVWHPAAQQVLIDKLEMRNFFIVWHLRDWSITDSKAEKVELEHDEDGSLTKPTMKRVYSMHSSIIDVVMTTFEKAALLTS